ncbi:hypothetical protein PTI98_007657 [Pleurotus ostreatus]|nr:hypothetical protein PTI98_007657 [Pleurotus ostreatus]
MRMLEHNAGLEKGSIVEAYIKPEHRQTAGQQYAHMKIRFDDWAQVNKAVQDGVFVQGKIVSVWKDKQQL